MEGGGWDSHSGIVKPVAALRFPPVVSTPIVQGMEDTLVSSLIDIASNR